MSKNVILMALEDDIRGVKQGIVAKIDELAVIRVELQKSLDDPTTIGLSKFIDPRSDATYLTALVATYNKATAVLDAKPDTKAESAPIVYKYKVKYTKDGKAKTVTLTSIHPKSDMAGVTNDVLDALQETVEGIKKVDAIIPINQPDEIAQAVAPITELIKAVADAVKDVEKEEPADEAEAEEEIESADDLLAGTDEESEDILADDFKPAKATTDVTEVKPATYKYEINYKVKGNAVVDFFESVIPPDDPDALDTAVLEYLKPKKITSYDEIFLLEE